MKRYARLLSALAAAGALICLYGCGDGEKPSPTPKPKPSPKTNGGGEKGEKKSGPVGEGFGHLKGRFVVTGELPTLPALKITQDADYCGVEFKVPNEAIVTGEGNTLANVVIYLRDNPEKIHESYKETENAEIPLDNKQCRFQPHICLLRSTQKLKILNSDPKSHNTKLGSIIQPFNESLAPKGQITKELAAERLPVPVNCNVHPWMQGHLVVKDHPYMAVSGEDGSFEIKNLPSGKLRFQAWHEQSGYLAVGAWGRGRFEVTIEPDKTVDLGDVSVPASLLKGN